MNPIYLVIVDKQSYKKKAILWLSMKEAGISAVVGGIPFLFFRMFGLDALALIVGGSLTLATSLFFVECYNNMTMLEFIRIIISHYKKPKSYSYMSMSKEE